jgi:peptidoglycan hydrolase-like protein with peptidoglycan-binding domain
MRRIVISSGHGLKIRGAAGSPVPPYLDEVNEARRVVDRVAAILNAVNVPTTVYHDNVSTSQNENLNRIVDFHNSKSRDLDISVHFNAYETTSKPMGTECLYVTQLDLAKQVASAVADAGHFIDRGPKKRTDLFFLNNTAMPSILIEVAFVDSKADADLYRANFEAICSAIAQAVSGQNIPVPVPPDPEPPEPGPVPPRPPQPPSNDVLKKGDTGALVVELQKSLGVLIADGEFGSITDIWVRAFQASCGLSADGVVGDRTWDEVEALNARLADGELPLPVDLANQIYTMAQQSEIADYSWPDRGVPPPGYIAGMALSFAAAFTRAENGDAAAKAMTKGLGHSDVDALSWYKAELAEQGITLGLWDQRLRALFTLMIGLGPRESSGKYCEGRDLSADNVASDTAEAGLFQTSWNINSAHPSILPLLDEFWKNPNGFLKEFKEGISPTANNLNSYGSGDGIQYQFMSRFTPLFHVLVTGIGLRTRRQHWGPVNRREVTIKREANALLGSVQELVESVA